MSPSRAVPEAATSGASGEDGRADDEAFGKGDDADLQDSCAAAAQERDLIGEALDDDQRDEDHVEDGDGGDFEQEDGERSLLVAL
ncbi:hypothetical protein [Tepidiforma sp.]|uniref:hypothetical protein n=1 Tax=Tepidiforma sp. TaxID=2682230 RepID=UPI00258885EE|nr:hypothetical protein [Tepidiforma sp.]